VQETTTMDFVEDFLVVEGNRDWRLLVTIDDSGNTTVATDCPGGPLTSQNTRLGLELVSFAHDFDLSGYWSGLTAPHVRSSQTGAALFEGNTAIRAASKGVCTDGRRIAHGEGRCKGGIGGVKMALANPHLSAVFSFLSLAGRLQLANVSDEWALN
jgi:hypothetical protein